MTGKELAERLTNGELLPASSADRTVPDRPGYYSIWIDEALNLPSPYREHLERRESKLLYVGIATRSLQTRLVAQDLRHKSPSTFFRAIAPILGFRPVHGSLVGKKNTRNYRFGPSDTASTVAWLNQHVAVRCAGHASPSKATEGSAISRLQPLLNTKDNPAALPELRALRDECRRTAMTPNQAPSVEAE